MNNKKLPIKTTSAIFLAIVLVAGTFAAISPSFIIGVNAQSEPYDYGYDSYKPEYKDKAYNSYEPDYGMDSYDKKPYGQESYGKDRDYDNSKDSRSDLLKKLKCNNINANLNNVDANFGSPPVEEGDTNGANGGADGEALAAQGSESISANGLMNGESDSDRSFVDRENDFAFVCINNNNNTVIEEQPLELVTCEDCFSADSTLQERVEDALVDQTLTITYIVIFDDFQTESLTIPANVDTIEQLCPLLEGHSDVLIDSIISSFLEVDTEAPNSGIDALIECLLEAGIIVDRELPPIEICDNGIDDDGDDLVDSEDPECLL